MEHPKLVKLQKHLNNFFTYFKDDNMLVISEDKSVLPFCYAIFDKKAANSILLSVAVDYPTSLNVAEIALKASTIHPTALTHVFYISTNGTTYVDSDAYRQWDLDTIDMEQIQPVSAAIN